MSPGTLRCKTYLALSTALINVLSSVHDCPASIQQVEFGAHQVILGRSLESLKDLPSHLRESNVLQMTVAQAKGLEFDNVFLWDFFNGSQADWRPLNNYVAYLEQQQETNGHKSLPAGTPLAEVC